MARRFASTRHGHMQAPGWPSTLALFPCPLAASTARAASSVATHHAISELAMPVRGRSAAPHHAGSSSLSCPPCAPMSSCSRGSPPLCPHRSYSPPAPAAAAGRLPGRALSSPRPPPRPIVGPTELSLACGRSTVPARRLGHAARAREAACVVRLGTPAPTCTPGHVHRAEDSVVHVHHASDAHSIPSSRVVRSFSSPLCAGRGLEALCRPLRSRDRMCSVLRR